MKENRSQDAPLQAFIKSCQRVLLAILGPKLALEHHRYFAASPSRRSSRLILTAVFYGIPPRRALMNRGAWLFRDMFHRYRC